jgi:hypothetical protein
MRLSKTLIASAVLLLTHSLTTLADEPSHVPATSQSKANAAVIAKADQALHGSLAGISNVWIFATGDSNAVFVSYTSDADHLALVEMQGDRIANLRDLNASTAEILTAAAR